MEKLIFLLFLAFIIGLIVYEQLKLKRIKKNLKKTTLFDDLINLGFKKGSEEKTTYKWLSKKEINNEYEYHCSFRIKNAKITFEIILEIKRRVLNENSGFIHDMRFSQEYRKKRLFLSSNSFIKDYKVKKVSNLPKADQIINDFNEMKKILRNRNIKTLPHNIEEL